ncbi:MAG: leucine-rich repeat domain-containing protein [Porphyromonadaceae bacterium]|nr:leucine-rich repeat domain-containing protein [Porphyromonadaceae bacterium]
MSYTQTLPTLTSVDLGKGLETIGTYAFSGASGLTSIELPATITAIGDYAFQNCTGLQSLIVNNPEPIIFTSVTHVFDGIDKNTCILYVPQGSVNDYKDFDLWKDFVNIREIGSDAVEQTIENFADITAQVGDDPITLNATASSELPVTYTIEEGKGSVATLEGNVLTIVGEGIVQITASQEGNNDYSPVSVSVTLTVLSYEWLEEVAIAVTGNTAKVVGTADAVAKFTKFYVNGAESAGNSADITEATGEISLKATTADGAEVVKLKIQK